MSRHVTLNTDEQLGHHLMGMIAGFAHGGPDDRQRLVTACMTMAFVAAKAMPYPPDNQPTDEEIADRAAQFLLDVARMEHFDVRGN